MTISKNEKQRKLQFLYIELVNLIDTARLQWLQIKLFSERNHVPQVCAAKQYIEVCFYVKKIHFDDI